MTPQRAHNFGVLADECVVVSDSTSYLGNWRVEHRGLVVTETRCPYEATSFVGRLRRIEAAGK